MDHAVAIDGGKVLGHWFYSLEHSTIVEVVSGKDD
jgi:hypothetical protein